MKDVRFVIPRHIQFGLQRAPSGILKYVRFHGSTLAQLVRDGLDDQIGVVDLAQILRCSPDNPELQWGARCADRDLWRNNASYTQRGFLASGKKASSVA